MKTNPEIARSRARRVYEQRTGYQVVPVRLSAEARERLERLSERYGGKRQAIEAALLVLDKDG